MDANVLRGAEVFGTAKNRGRRVLPVDLAREGDPIGAGVVALPPVLAFAGQVNEVARIDAVVLIFLQPLHISPERHAAVVILAQGHGLLRRALLRALDVEKETVVRGVMDGDGPDFMQRIHALVARADGEGMFDAERDLPLLALQFNDLAELDSAQVLGLVPEISLLSVEPGHRPGKKQRVLMGMVGRKIPGDLLPGGRENGMDVTAPAEVRLDAFWDRFFGFDVFQNRLAAQGDADLFGRFGEFQITGVNGLKDGADRAGEQEGEGSGMFHER